MNEVNAVLAIASRDVTKFLRDPGRLIGTFVLPFLLMSIMGGSLQANLGSAAGFNFVGYTFTGVLGMTMFQSAAGGIASLLEDRQNDFAQEMFVAPVSRYSIVLGKIVGETCVAISQGVPLIAFALVLQVPLTVGEVLLLIPVALFACLLGGSFGLAALALMRDQRAAVQLFNFLVLPQFFLAGVFNPIQKMPWYLDILSHIAPMRYVVDLFRDVVYAGRPEYDRVVLQSPQTNIAVMAVLFVVFITIGTFFFVRRETNR